MSIFPSAAAGRGVRGRFFNKLLVFLATGLWHGTGWTFVLWGLWHGAFCGAETLLDRNKTLQTHWYGHVYTLLVVIFGFVLFRGGKSSAGAYAAAHDALWLHARGCLPPCTAKSPNGGDGFLVPGGRACLPSYGEHAKAHFDGSRWLSAVLDALTIVGLLLCLMQLASHSFQPFIYASF